MSFVNRFCSLTAICGFALTASAQSAESVRLSTIAAANGYTYQWMTSEAGATLLRPGVRIVIRAGRLFYEVNEATPVADQAPRFDGRDLVISSKLAEHLREIALKYPYAPEAPLADAPTVGAMGTLTINARQIPGREALALTGTGPANVPVTITLTGEMSTDLPVVTLIKKTVMTATDGTFSAEAYYGQDTHASTTLAATVTSLHGAVSAVSRVTIGMPSADVKSSALDVWPKK